MALRLFDVQYPHEPVNKDEPLTLFCPLCGMKFEGTVGDLLALTGMTGVSGVSGAYIRYEFEATVPHACEGGTVSGRLVSDD